MARTTLEKEMVNSEVSRNDICELLGITYQSLLNKLQGKQQFKCKEMFAIKKKLKSKLPLEKLFADYI